jgi:predicted nucleic acid-binding protein
LLLIGHVDLLQSLFGQVVIPQAVHDELSAERSAGDDQTWIAHPPSWLQIQYATTNPDASLGRLHLGEREAIMLAEQLKADLIVWTRKQHDG